MYLCQVLGQKLTDFVSLCCITFLGLETGVLLQLFGPEQYVLDSGPRKRQKGSVSVPRNCVQGDKYFYNFSKKSFPFLVYQVIL